MPFRFLAFPMVFAMAVLSLYAEIDYGQNDTWPLIDRAKANARAAESLPAWREKIADRRPRLFFSPREWRELPARYTASEGPQRVLFDNVLAIARKLADTPATPYQTPEAMVGPRLPLSEANSELWQRTVGDEITLLSLALQLKDDPSVKARLHDSVLTACAYPSWGRNSQLATSHMARGVAIAYDWHPELWSEDDRKLIRDTIRKRAGELDKALYGGSFWGAAYTSNHNHVGSSALGLCGLAFLDEIPEAAGWIGSSLEDFDRVVRYNNADGSTDEGMTYWSYSMSFLLQYIEGTRRVLGTDALYQSDFLKNAIAYRLYTTTPGFGGPLPWGDVGGASGGGSGFRDYRLSSQYRSGEGQYMADHLPYKPADNADPNSGTWAALWFDPTLAEQIPTRLDFHAGVVDLVTSRTGWTDHDYLLTVKSGFTNRSHAHLDAGALALSFGDEWLLLSSRYGRGKEDGTKNIWDRKGKRWNYFSCATESQATLVVNGRNQNFAPDARGTIDEFVSTDDWCFTSVDLIKAYHDVSHIRREVLHRRGDYILVFDDIEAPKAVTVEWLAQVSPKAECNGGSIKTSGKTGSLEIRALVPTNVPFALHTTYSPSYDLPAERLKTVALKTDGTSVRYLVALLPAKSGGAAPVRDISYQPAATGGTVIVQGKDWTDQIVYTSTEIRATRRQSAGTESPVFTVKRH